MISLSKQLFIVGVFGSCRPGFDIVVLHFAIYIPNLFSSRIGEAERDWKQHVCLESLQDLYKALLNRAAYLMHNNTSPSPRDGLVPRYLPVLGFDLVFSLPLVQVALLQS